MCVIYNGLSLTSCTTATSFAAYFRGDVMLEMVLFIFEMLLATRHALLTRLLSHTAPSFRFARWQPFQSDVLS